MKRKISWLFALLTILGLNSAIAEPLDYSNILNAVAKDIVALKNIYPQLKDFSVSQNLSMGELNISYQYHTHKSENGAGWTAGVPNPDKDGLWFYIDFHHPDSAAQIHNQPAKISPEYCIGEKKITFLILEGEDTQSIDGAIWEILKKHGVKECE